MPRNRRCRSNDPAAPARDYLSYEAVRGLGARRAPTLHVVSDGDVGNGLLLGGLHLLYVVERAYHDSWRFVRDGIAPESKWIRFVDNWASDAFAEYVSHLERELDELATAAGAAERERMAELFELTTRYEIAFWEMAVAGETWPGIPEGT